MGCVVRIESPFGGRNTTTREPAKKKSRSTAPAAACYTTLLRMYFIHGVCQKYDSELDYEHLARSICGDSQCLIMMETKGGEHAHFQGMTNLPKKELLAIAKEWGEDHVLKKRKRSNPVHADDKKFTALRFSWKDHDWTGFQYCCKEYTNDSVLVYKQGFTEQDLIDLHENSNRHREVLSAKLGEFVSGQLDLSTPGTPKELHFRVARAAFRYYVAEEKMHPPNLKQLVRTLLYKSFPTPEVEEYLVVNFCM